MESDPNDWPARAAADSALVAATLLHLRIASWPPPPLPKKWGCHARRSIAGTAMLRRKDARPRIFGGKKVRRRPSPMTPLEYYGGGGVSESGSEEIAGVLTGSGISVGGCGGPETKVVNVGALEPSDLKLWIAKPIRRSSAATKQQALMKLHAMHTSLLEYRESHLKELEVRGRAKAVLLSKNLKLKQLQVSLESQKRSSTAAQMTEEVHPKRLRSCNTFVELPDLNIPVIRESD